MLCNMVNPPPVNQYTIVEPFSENSHEIINQIFKTIFHDVDYLTTPMKDVTGIVPAGPYFDATFNATSVTITSGTCIINNVLIETSSNISLNVNSGTSYLFYASDTDRKPTEVGTNYVFVVMYYDPSVFNNAYVTLIGKPSVYELKKDKCCILGFLKTTLVGSNLVINGFQSYHPILDLHRKFLPQFMDGGWMYERCLLRILDPYWIYASLDTDASSEIIDGGLYE
jgi:hypothetical protein